MAAGDSPSDSVTTYLRSALALLENTSPFKISYRESTVARTPLTPLISSTFSDGVDLYHVLLLRKLILLCFEVLCKSEEVVEDVQYSYGECKNILLSAEHFNQKCSSCSTTQLINPATRANRFPRISAAKFSRKTCKTRLGLKIELSDFIDVYVSSHANFVSSLIVGDSMEQNLLTLVRFESSFAQALLGLMATHTSLLVHSQKHLPKTQVFVSEEMFAVHLSQGKASWLDCLVPGEQPDLMKRLFRDVFKRLWSSVAKILTIRSLLVVPGGWRPPDKLQPLVTAAKHSELQYHPVVVNCLEHVVRTYHQQCTFLLWHKAFQEILIMTLLRYRKRWRMDASSGSITEISSRAMSTIDQHLTSELEASTTPVSIKSPESILQHVNMLEFSLPLCSALLLSSCHVISALVHSLRSNLSSWNQVSLGWLLFKEVPAWKTALERVMVVTSNATSPRVSFPNYSIFHSLETRGRNLCVSLHKTAIYWKDEIERLYILFQTLWSSKCAEVLRASFPPPKYWKNTKKKELAHSPYCEAVLADLFFPLVEAGQELSLVPQRNYVYLILTVFLTEYRRTITANRKLYTPSAGRQLLADYKYLKQWLSECDAQLERRTIQLLFEAPVFIDFEKGLQTLSGAATPAAKSDDNVVKEFVDGSASFLSLPFKHFPVLAEVAWQSSRDWTNCVK